MKRSTVAFAISCFLVIVLSGGIAPPVFAQSSASAQSKAAEYAGSESCKTCHEEVYKSWENGPHWKQTLKEGALPSTVAKIAMALALPM
jgi:hypothetical protein